MDFLKDIKKTSDLLMNANEEKFQEIDLDKIEIDPTQPRKIFDNIDDLAESIRLHGVLSPITLFINDNVYRICYGERRFRAAKQAGLKSIPAVIVNTNFEDIFEKQLVENVQRQELNFDEIAETIKYLIDVQKKKKKDIAKSLSKSNSYITLYYNYAKIDNYIKELLTPKTKDITLIVEINKFLNNAEPDIYAAALDYIKSIDNISRNIIEKLNNLSNDDNKSIITDEDLARPNIGDYLDELAETNINEIVQELETNEKDDNDIAENHFNAYEIGITENIDNIDTSIKKTSNKQNMKENRQMWYKDIYLDLYTKNICNSDDKILIMLSDELYRYLFENNKLSDMLKFVYKIRVQNEK